jgi:hypothetical protein
MRAPDRSGRSTLVLFSLVLLAIPIAAANSCSAGGASGDDDDGVGNAAATTPTGTNTGGDIGFDGGPGGQAPTGDPKTCEEAAAYRSYIGCDFWPTVVANEVWSIFDYAVVVANAGDNPVDATVMRGGNPIATAQIPPNELRTIYLPWVPELKGPDFDEYTSVVPVPASMSAVGGAYHLTTTYPVTVYQFSALEYAGQGGPPGKDWSSCPGNYSGTGCFSFSNDASLLLPSTAFTANYRVAGVQGWVESGYGDVLGSYIAITASQASTNVTVHLSPTGQVIAGGIVPGGGPGGSISFALNQGDVAELLGPAAGDLSGSWVEADKPVQVIAGIPCIFIPAGNAACDHVEESVFPAETLGQHYFVTRPAGPLGNAPGHVVRIYGNVDGTSLTYLPSAPPGAPASISAGQVVDLGVVSQDFEITGDKAFAVASFLLAATIVDPSEPDPTQQKGDPAQSLATAVEQYRKKYIFLAPTDYDINYLDIIHPTDAMMTIDGASWAPSATPISSGFNITRLPLNAGQQGAHVLESDQPVGIQVEGYGSYTSYYYPGGLDLKQNAPPPIR